MKKNIERAKTLVESGGDWDRRNRLKAYQGLHLLTVRSYNLAAPLLLDSLSTFTSYELCSYSNLVVYSVLAGSVSLKRVDFKSKVVDAPEIRAILGDGEDKLAALSGATAAGPGAGDEEMGDATTSATPTPAPAAVNLTAIGSSSAPQEVEAPIDFTPLAGLVRSLYMGNYSAFFLALAAVEENFLSQDRYLYEHRGWFVREMRLRAYQQLLQSYRVVGLGSMAKDFGISVDFLDRYVSPCISSIGAISSPYPSFRSLSQSCPKAAYEITITNPQLFPSTATSRNSSQQTASHAPSTASTASSRPTARTTRTSSIPTSSSKAIA